LDHLFGAHLLTWILGGVVSIFIATLRGVYHLGKLSKDKETRDKQIDDHEGRIGDLEETVVIHGQRFKRVDPAGE
jgi:hypothetical protein